MCVIFSLISFFANEDLNENSNTSDFYEKNSLMGEEFAPRGT